MIGFSAERAAALPDCWRARMRALRSFSTLRSSVVFNPVDAPLNAERNCVKMKWMLLEVRTAELPEILIFTPRLFRDDRGSFEETFHVGRYEAAGLPFQFVQDNHSHSRRNVLRGLHYQRKFPQGKLIYVVSGEIFDVAVDLRRKSTRFGRWFGTRLSAENHVQIFIPPGFAHGFCVLSETADVIYKCTDYYHSDDDFGIHWSDPTIAIQWPLEQPILSDKDSKLKLLSEIPADDLPE